MFEVEHNFTLPMGLIDEDGTLHRDGVMRLATAADEILPLQDPRVQRNPAYLSLILLSRVVLRIGGIEGVTPRTLEGLFAADLAHLQDIYNAVNRIGGPDRVSCPHCERDFDLEVDRLGGIAGYPLDRVNEEMAYLAYHLHWSHAELMELDHRSRRGWIEQVSALNDRMAVGAA